MDKSHQILHVLIQDAKKQKILSFDPHGQNGEFKLQKEMESLVGPLIRVGMEARETFLRLSVMYHRDTQLPKKPFLDSILTQSHKRHYPKYKVERLSTVWSTRLEFLEYLSDLELEAQCIALFEKKKWHSILDLSNSIHERWCLYIKTHCKTGIPWLKTFTSGTVLTRILHLAVQANFKLKFYQKEALLLDQLLQQRVYLEAKRGSWFDEYCKILHLYLDKNKAKEKCLEALDDPFVLFGRRRSIQKRMRTLSKNNLTDCPFGPIQQFNIQGQKQSGTHRPLWKDSTGEWVFVEQFALDFYKQYDWKGVHSESSVMTTLFGILFWDILFMDVPGVFFSEFQSAPLDLGDSNFYETRRNAIHKRLSELDECAASLIKTVDDRERPLNTLCIGVNWSLFSLQDLLEITACFKPGTLEKVCLLFARHYKVHRGGIPDLCLWKPLEGRIQFIEVKGPGDTLSDKQKEWMYFFNEIGIEAHVLTVSERVSEAVSVAISEAHQSESSSSE